MKRTGTRFRPRLAHDHYDAIVIGGSYAGLSAALQLARARRRVLVIDAGVRRNRFASASHGFLGHDGRAPEAVAAEGRSQLLAYPNVRWVDGLAEDAHHRPDGRFGFRVGNAEVSAARLVLATGVRDELPPLAGLAERWGRSVFHCPYCHGYEMDAGRIGIVHPQRRPGFHRQPFYRRSRSPSASMCSEYFRTAAA